MNDFERRLRETLERRAAEATASADAWERIEERVQAEPRRPRQWFMPALVLGTATAVIVGAVAFIERGDDSDEVVAGGSGSESNIAVLPFPGIWPVNTWEGYEELSASVADGHQPLMTDPVQVTTQYLDQRGVVEDFTIGEMSLEDYSDCRTISYGTADDEVEGLGSVEVCRLGAEDGPWVVMSASTDRLTLADPVYQNPLEFTVSTKVAAEITAMAGSLDGDWLAETFVPIPAVDPGGFLPTEGGVHEVKVVLDLGGSPPDAVLVRIEHSPNDGGPSAFAEFRLDLSEDAARARDPHWACDVVPEARPGQLEADQVLRRWMADQVGTADVVADEFGGTSEMEVTGFTIVGDRERSDGRVETCLATEWEEPDDAAGHTLDIVILNADDGAWKVDGIARGPLVRDIAPPPGIPVVFLNPSAECGQSDDEFETIEIEVRGGENLSEAKILGLLTGPPSESELTTSLPAHARLLSVEERADGTAVVNLSAVTDGGGGSCLQNARVEQIRRTLLADPGAKDVIIQVEGETEGTFQP